MALYKNVNEAPSFFAAENQYFESNDLISSQVDPTDPQVQGLTSYTDPLVVDQVIRERLRNFDPLIYDLSPSSHLVRFMSAVLGCAGVGGLRRQQTINRLSHILPGAHFLDLDGFWGALFSSTRMSDETLETINDVPLHPSTTVADCNTWDAVASRDGKYRSRILALAHAYSMGGTYDGVRLAAEAVLGCEVDLIESWMIADELPPGYDAETLQANTWAAVEAHYRHYADMDGTAYSELTGGLPDPGNLPLGNRGEVIITPKRPINQEEHQQVAEVVSTLAPAWVVITVNNSPVSGFDKVDARFLYADSTDWSVVSTVTAYQEIDDPNVYYSGGGKVESGRPALSKYSGERWEYSSRTAHVTAYQMVDHELVSTVEDAQYLVFGDGTSAYYAPSEAMRDPRSVALARMGMEGVLINYPYAAERYVS